MGIFLSVANNLKPLTQKLATDLHTAKPDDAFTPQWVITQTEGMNSWLKQKLAYENSITANIRFNKPNDIVNRIYYMLAQGLKVNAIDTETMKWTLFELLDQPEFQQLFPDIAAYYADNKIRQIAFADELADLFDQYQVYRFDIIENWNQLWIHNQHAEDWQSWLWINIKEKLNGSFRDKSEISQLILERLASEDAREHVKSRISSLHFFGIAVITPYYLRIFHELSRFIDIHFYLINPAPNDYWLDDRSELQIARLRKRDLDTSMIRVGNDLLHNWGKIIKESFYLLFQHDDFVNQYEVTDTAHSTTSSLLNIIKDNIHNNINNKETALPIQENHLKDRSITINGCYTPLREVETLYNYLVELVDNANEGISPRDILVLVTDIDLYAPYIKAVFNFAPYRFPITIADETITADNNLFTALQDILTLDSTYFKAEEVLKLFESPYIRNRFQIKDVEALRVAIQQAGIYFSMDGRKADDTRYISWSYGLKKLRYGICMSGEEEYSDGEDSFFPSDTSEGADALERIKLIHFISILQAFLADRDKPKTISGWADYVMQIMEELIFASGDKDDDDYTKFIQLLEETIELQEISPMEVSFEVFRHSFLHKLKKENRASLFAGAGITFCSMVPMRSIPYKTVAMLGMNFDKFPRMDSPLSFSLINKEWRHGDRNVKNNDKHLFLETILSAEENLYISYIARDAKDGAKLPPSSLVDELIDYIARALDQDTDSFKETWVTIHPLHSFSKKYFEPNGLKNYLNEDRYRSGIEVEVGTNENTEVDRSIINSEQFSSFFKNPAKGLLNNKYGVYYWESEVLIPEHEIFELNNLDEYIIKNELIKKTDLDADEQASLLSKKIRAGQLPLSNMGKAYFEELVLETETHREKFKSLTEGITPEKQEINLQINDYTITGSIPLYHNKFINIYTSSKIMVNVLVDFISFQLAVASMDNPEEELIFVGVNQGGEQFELSSNELNRDELNNYLEDLLQKYVQGQEDFLHFWPQLGKKNYMYIKDGWNTFYQKYNSHINSKFNIDFNDIYLTKAIENGFFSRESFDDLEKNVREILKPIEKYFPNLLA